MENEKIVKYDVDGYDTLTNAVMSLINQYPALKENEIIEFSILDTDSGMAMYPSPEAVINTEKTFITGRVLQECFYSMHIVYRTAAVSEKSRIRVKEWLDNMGRWLSKEPVVIDGETYKLNEYPPLADGRKIVSFDRNLQTQSHIDNTLENKGDDWVIKIVARYENEFYK